MLMVVYKFPTSTGTQRALTISTVSRGQCFPARKTGMAGEVVATVWGERQGARSGPLIFWARVPCYVRSRTEDARLDSVRNCLTAAGSAAAILAFVAATVWRHEHAAFGTGWRSVESNLRRRGLLWN